MKIRDKLNRRVVQMVKEEEWLKLEDLLLDTEEDCVLQIVSGWVREVECPQWVGGVLTALTCNTRESTNLRVKIYERVVRCVQEGVCASERCAGELMGVLMVRADSFPSSAIITLVDHYLDLIKEGKPLQGRWVDLLAKLLSSASRREEMTVDGKEMAGEDYRYQIIRSLCDLPWYPEMATCLLPVFSDMKLPKEELEDVIFKVEHVLKEVEYQSVPPIMYQLLNLARTKLPGRVIRLVLHYFTQQENKLAKEDNEKEASKDINSLDMDSENIDNSKYHDLTEAKGTVILHVTHFAQYNPSLVRDYIKFIKSSTWLAEKLITPFNLALSLSLSSIERYEEQILTALKTCLLRTFREDEHKLRSQWLRTTWGSDSKITTAFTTTVQNCVMGWDQVSHGLVQLAFSLLECGGGLKGETYCTQQAIQLATTILPRIVKMQPHLIQSVLSRLTNFIFSATSPHIYIEVLGKLSKTVPLSLLKHFSVIRSPLDYLEYLAPTPASLLITAYSPLFRMNMALKDAVMIILRKMLSSKKMENRHVAVLAYLQFLRNFRLMGTLPSSQASMSFSSSLSTSVSADVHTIFSSSTNEALCLELLGILRCCFSQQHEVKSTFYLGLHEVCQANPKLTISILEILFQHIRGFLDLRSDILNPVVLKKVVVVQGDSVVLVEPMGDIISSLGACRACYEKQQDSLEDDDEEDNTATLNKVCSAFDVLTERLSGCDLEDMGINTNGDFSNGSSSGQKNILSCQVMVGVFDSLIENKFINGTEDLEDKLQAVISLFKSQRKIVDLVNEKSSKSGKNGEGSKGKGRPSNKAPVIFKRNLNLRVATDMLAVSLSPSSNGHILKNNHGFQMYLLSAVEENIATVKGLSKPDKEKILPQLKILTRVLLHECMEKLGSADSSEEREVVRLRKSLNILHTLMIIFSKYYKDRLEVVLKEVLDKTNNKKLDTLLYKFAKRCQKMLLRILHHEESTPLLKDASVIIQIMSTITQVMDPECTEVGDVQDWIHQLCKDQELDHGELAKSLMNLLIKLSNQIKFNHNLTRGVAKELHHKLGDFEEGVEVEETNKYKIVSENTSSAILSSVLSHLDDTLNLVELVLNKMKACASTNTEFTVDEVEKCISVKLMILMVSTHEIIQSALPDSTTIDQTLRVLTKLYNILSLYVKYYLDLYKVKSNTQISDKFEKVVHTSAEMISKPVYPMITYIESTQRHVGNKKHSSLTARAIKESKLIPSLVFSIEQYEKNLISLTKKSKVNLMEGMKLSTARDFRIMPNALLDNLEKDNGEEKEDNPEENRDADEDGNGEDSTSQTSGQESDDNNDDRQREEPTKSQFKTGKKRKSGGEEVVKENENNPNSQNTTSSKEPPSKKGKKTLLKSRLSRKV